MIVLKSLFKSSSNALCISSIDCITTSSEIIVGEGLDEPIKFKNGGKVSAVGGIYIIDNTYKFRIKFQNLEDQ